MGWVYAANRMKRHWLDPIRDVWFFANVPSSLSLDEGSFDYDPGEDYQQLTIPFDVEQEAENAGNALRGKLIVFGEDVWFTAQPD